jgi:multiple sugar transport system permease protein
VLLLVAFGVLPTGYAVYFAFTDAGGTFTGLSNFLTTARDFRFMDAVSHVAVYLVLWLVSLVVFVVGLALPLHRLTSKAAGKSLRFLFYVPGALAGAASVLVWLFMLDPTVSPVAPLLEALGFSTFGAVIAPANPAHPRTPTAHPHPHLPHALHPRRACVVPWRRPAPTWIPQ